MTIQERGQLAADLKSQCNCCQAVVLALKDQVHISEEDLFNMAGSFGLGMRNMKGTCGALVGAEMIAGLVTGGDRAAAKNINEKFEELSGAVICGDLKGIKTGKVLCPCEECCRNAVLAYGMFVDLK